MRMETKVYNQAGKESGSVTLPEAIFGTAWKPDLVHEVVVAMQGNARAGTAHTKDRSEVAGGGKKPWRQKGTGRARHGSRRSPIWTGGGVTFGPRNEKDFTRKLNKKVKQKALASTLSKKHADGELILVESFTFEKPTAKDAKAALAALATGSNHADLAAKRKNAALIVLAGRNENAEKSFQNFGNVMVTKVADINPVDLLTYKYIVMAEPTETLAALEKRVA